MSVKETNRGIIKDMLFSEYWLPENDYLFDQELTIDFPNAPPGMPQHMNSYEARLFRNWLTRTVLTWSVDQDLELYSTADPEDFWAIRNCSGQVRWAGVRGTFESEMASHIRMKDGKIFYIKEYFNPLAFLNAIGRPAPVFHVDLADDRVLAMRDELKRSPTPAFADVDLSAEAVQARRQANLDAFREHDFEKIFELQTVTPDFHEKIHFLPPEMKAEYGDEDKELIQAWSMASNREGSLGNGIVYETDDPLVFFCETGMDGVMDWIGNNAPGYYRNNYLMVGRLAQDGRLAVQEEFLNPINKLNSINVSIPSFPYYF